jgi:hypothetical protein
MAERFTEHPRQKAAGNWEGAHRHPLVWGLAMQRLQAPRHPLLHPQIFGRSQASLDLRSKNSVGSFNRCGNEPHCCHRRHAGPRGYRLRPGPADVLESDA